MDHWKLKITYYVTVRFRHTDYPGCVQAAPDNVAKEVVYSFKEQE